MSDNKFLISPNKNQLKQMKQKFTIRLDNMVFYAYHGHFGIEQNVGNHFHVDLVVKTSDSRAALTDNLDEALDYQKLYAIVKSEMNTPSRLLEHVANRIADRINSECKEVTAMKIKISKINPPLGGEIKQVSVILKR